MAAVPAVSTATDLVARGYAKAGTAGDDVWKPPRRCPKAGIDVVQDPIYNKGTAFDYAERDRLRLRGLVPPGNLDIDTQVEKVLEQLDSIEDPLSKAQFVQALQDRNETLFFKLLIDNIAELAPIIYTPTVGKVCQKFGDQFRRARGMYLSTRDRGEFGSIVYNWPREDVKVICVTDGSRILGLGDLGCNGMGIPIGKLALYVAAGGIDPKKVLPVQLDAGTNNGELLASPYYLGMHHARLAGKEHMDLVHEMINALHNRWPDALIQFEDFSSDTALDILTKYRHNYLCFNDDIQGTGATTLAGILTAVKQQESQLKDQRIVVCGAGSAGMGVATTLLQGMVHQGLSAEEAQSRFFVMDQYGLVGKSRKNLTSGQQYFARADMDDKTELLDVVKAVKPTMILGLTGVGGTWTEDIIREMSANCKRPIVFPLSNPTSSAECSAEQAYAWTDGSAIFASGSPFDPVEYKGKTLYPSQCNNMFIFPGVGLGATLIGAKRITEDMFWEAANALSDCVSEEELAKGMCFPEVHNIRNVSAHVAEAVINRAMNDGLARINPKTRDLRAWVQNHMWIPEYRSLIPWKSS